MIQKDYDRAQRLNEVYKHLFAHHGITSQKAMAEHLGMQRTGLSAAMNGSKANLTDSLFKKICASWPGVFVLDYLLTGEGNLLTPEEEYASAKIEQGSIMFEEQQNNILELYARMIRGVDDLRQQIKIELADLQKAKSDLQQARDEFRGATNTLMRLISRLEPSSHHDIGLAAEDLKKI